MNIGDRFDFIREIKTEIDKNNFSYNLQIDNEELNEYIDYDENISENKDDESELELNEFFDEEQENQTEKINSLDEIKDDELKLNSMIILDTFLNKQYKQTFIFQKDEDGYEIVAVCDVPLCD